MTLTQLTEIMQQYRRGLLTESELLTSIVTFSQGDMTRIVAAVLILDKVEQAEGAAKLARLEAQGIL